MASTGAAGGRKSSRPASPKRTPRKTTPKDAQPTEAPEPTAPEPATNAPASSPRTGKKRGPYNVKRVEKTPFSCRLPDDVLALIDQARDEAAAHGDRLTNDEVITMAVRSFWGKQRQRRR